MESLKNLIEYAASKGHEIQIHYPSSSLSSWEREWSEYAAVTSNSIYLGIKAKKHGWMWWEAMILNAEELNAEEVDMMYDHTYYQSSGSKQRRYRDGWAIEIAARELAAA